MSSLSTGALALIQGSARYCVMRARSLCVVLLLLVLLASPAYEPISMSKKAAKSIRPWSARAYRPKASDLFDSHAPHVEGSSASPPSLAVGTRQSVTSLGAGTPARQATVRDSITGPPACDATTEATVSAVHARSTRSNSSGAARAPTSTSTVN